MEFVEFIKEKNRLTGKCSIFCNCCKFSATINPKAITCERFIESYPEEAERVLQEWIKEDEQNVDWSSVSVDTLIEVSEGNDIWKKRYFAEYENEDIYVWNLGTTSHTATAQESWKYNRLIKEEK